MSALLKGPAAALAARPLAARPAAMLEIVCAHPAPSADALELAELRAECGRLGDALDGARQQLDAAVAEAMEAGRVQGRAEVRSDDEKKLALIGEGLSGATSVWEAKLAALDELAAQLVSASVRKIFGAWQPASELVVRAIQARLETLRGEAVLAIRVSSRDFPDEAELCAAAERTGRPKGQLVADSELQAGECRIELSLGAVDIGPSSQIAALAALLDDPRQERAA